MSSNPASFLPLRPVEFGLLLALVAEEQHGYALAGAIAEHTGGTTRLEPGNLYRVIKRLVDDGLVAPSERRATEAAADERRRYYRLTPLGQQVAAAEARRLRALLATEPARTLAGLPELA